MTVTDLDSARTQPGSLAEALAALQGELPRIAKAETARVRSDKGSYEYTYADLAAVSHAIMPLMAKNGLSFVCTPTLTWNDERPETAARFVLEYSLRHASGESIHGYYPLPSGLSPQQTGSAITYARRYCLCAVTGVAPEDDDDAAAAEAGVRQQARQASSQPQRRLQSAPKQEKPKDEAAAEGAHPDAALAQTLAEKAVELTDIQGATVETLQVQVYEVARRKQLLRAEIVHPMTGEKQQLTRLISETKKILTDRNTPMTEVPA